MPPENSDNTGETVEIYTDGACRGNPGPGGWGALLYMDGRDTELCGGEAATTNNRMELMAAIQALEFLPSPSKVVLTTDSEYVYKGITQWLEKWEQKGWRTRSGGKVKNVDLWQRLQRAAARHGIDWQWVRGHAGHAGNERADALANRGMDEPDAVCGTDAGG